MTGSATAGGYRHQTHCKCLPGYGKKVSKSIAVNGAHCVACNSKDKDINTDKMFSMAHDDSRCSCH